MLKTAFHGTVGTIGALAVTAALAVPACTATGDNTFSTGGAGAGHGSGAGNGGDDISFDAGHSDAKSDAEGCAGQHTIAQQLPLDMYIMLDQSGSMDETVNGGVKKWTAVTDALKTFVSQPNTAGISVGIQYFPLTSGGVSCPPLCASDADCGAFGPCFIFVCLGCAAAGDSCNAADYAKADVEIAPLPGVKDAIITSIGMHGPTGSTPTSAALQGAVDHAKTWAGAHPSHVVIDVLVTDGDPTECDTSVPNIAAIAANGANGSPKVLTFVIGVGNLQSNLDSIAQAGGTGSAFVVDTNANVNQQFLDALNKIRGSVLSCSYEIPDPQNGELDYNAVNVQYIPGDGGPAQNFPKVQDKAHCPPNGDAWFYDDNAHPTQIVMCDATCAKLSADSKGQVDIVLGCKTIVN